MSDGAKIGLRDFVVALITAAASITASFFMFQGSLKQADADLVGALYVQVQNLQKEIRARDDKIYELQEQITFLRIQISKKYEASEILRNYLDAVPHIAWIKLASGTISETPKFTMWHINKYYEDYFDISKARYIGRTDYEIWPQEIADQFYKNDIKTLSRMDENCITESFPKRPNGKVEMVTARVCKFVTMIDGHVAIAGYIIPNGQLSPKSEQ